MFLAQLRTLFYNLMIPNCLPLIKTSQASSNCTICCLILTFNLFVYPSELSFSLFDASFVMHCFCALSNFPHLNFYYILVAGLAVCHDDFL